VEPQRSVPQIGQWPETAGPAAAGGHYEPGATQRPPSSFLIPEPEEAKAREGRAYAIGGVVLGISLAVLTVAVLVTAVVLAIRAH